MFAKHQYGKVGPNVTVTSTTLASVTGSLDSFISPSSALRLWMLLAMILAVLLLMMIVVCCFIKIRIPRTKREIEMYASRRKKRGSMPIDLHNYHATRKVIVMSSIPASQALLSPPAAADPESMSCTSCATSEDNRNMSTHGSRDSLEQTSPQPENNKPKITTFTVSSQPKKDTLV